MPEGPNITKVMDTTITMEMKWGTYKRVCSSFLYRRDRISLSSSARMMGAGKVKMMLIRERSRVLVRYVTQAGKLKKYWNHFRPTHWLPSTPE